MRFNVAGMIVALNLKGAGPSAPYVNDACVFAGPLDDAVAFCGQTAKMHFGGFVGAVFAPHHAIDAKLREGGNASERLEDAVILFRSNAVLGQQLRGHRNRLGRYSSRRDRIHRSDSIVAWYSQFPCRPCRVRTCGKQGQKLRALWHSKLRLCDTLDWLSKLPSRHAGMAELADAADSKSADPCGRGGSTPPPGTKVTKRLSPFGLSKAERPESLGGCFGGSWFLLYIPTE